MTNREPWALLAALDELLARPGWQEDLDATMAMEFRIADETGVGRLRDEYLDALSVPMTIEDQIAIAAWQDTHAWKWPHSQRSVGAPFLRSRDAAAMLEATLIAHLGAAVAIRVWRDEASKGWRQHISWGPSKYVQALQVTEATVRVRAPLEVGWRTELWPVKKEGAARGDA